MACRGVFLSQNETPLRKGARSGWTRRKSNPGPADRCERRLRVYSPLLYVGRAVGAGTTLLGLDSSTFRDSESGHPEKLSTVNDQPSPTVDPWLGWTVTLRERRRNRCC